MIGRHGPEPPDFCGDYPHQGRRYTPFNNGRRGGIWRRPFSPRLEHAPEIAADIDAECPPSVAAKAARNVKAQYIEHRERAESERGEPTLAPAFERGGAIDPDGVRERSERNSSGCATKAAERNWKKWRENAVLDPLTDPAATDEFVEVVPRPGGGSAEIDEMLPGQSVVTAKDPGRDCVQQKSAGPERLLQIECNRRPEEIASPRGRPVLSPDAAGGQMRAELKTFNGETRWAVQRQRQLNLGVWKSGNGRLEAPAGGTRVHRE